MTARTGCHAVVMNSWYSSGRSRPSLRTARDITCQRTVTSRTCSTSSIQREVIHAHGQRGSNQKSAIVVSDMPRFDHASIGTREPGTDA